MEKRKASRFGFAPGVSFSVFHRVQVRAPLFSFEVSFSRRHWLRMRHADRTAYQDACGVRTWAYFCQYGEIRRVLGHDRWLTHPREECVWEKITVCYA